MTKKKSYPLPVIDDILALLGKAKYFTSFDLKSGYWQVLIEESDRECSCSVSGVDVGGFVCLMSVTKEIHVNLVDHC